LRSAPIGAKEIVGGNTPASYRLIERLIGVDRSTALARGGAERFEAPERARRQGTGGAGLRLI